MTVTLSCDAFFYSESGEDLRISMTEIRMNNARYLEDGAYLGKGTQFSYGERKYEITSMYTRLAHRSSKEGLVMNVIYIVRPK